METVVIKIKTEKPVSVAAYLEEVIRQIRRNEYFAISEYEVKKE
jgi:hypothetical protein